MHGQLTALSALPAKPATADHGAHAALTYESALALVRERLPMALPRTEDVAAFFNRSRITVWRWATTGKLAFLRPGGKGHRVYPHEAIARFLVQHAGAFDSADGPAPGAPFAVG